MSPKELSPYIFADDTNIFYSHENIDYLAHMLYLEIDKISVWLRVNEIKQSSYYLNPDRRDSDLPSNCMLTTRPYVKWKTQHFWV